MAKTQDVRIGVHVNAAGLDKVWRDLKEVSAGAEKELIAELKQIATVVKIDAQSRIGNISPRIMRSTRVVSRAGRRAHVAVSVVAGGAKAPHARAFENRGREGDFRHPVFGDREKWVAQTAHPYLGPALRSQIDVIPRRVSEAIERVTRRYGLS